jgi:hypothetical protein
VARLLAAQQADGYLGTYSAANRFANPEAANLYSKDGLPVGPFRTENW